ncbi:MAG: glucuronate isomerase, partial [Limisphaerales bacterium]
MPELLHPDRLLPVEAKSLDIARGLYNSVKSLPIISPHGHTDAGWFAKNVPFSNPTELLITPDHYVYRMLYSQGISLARLGISTTEQALASPPAPEVVWRLFADHYYLFQGTPTRIWFDHVFAEVFELTDRLNPGTADHFYEVMQTKLDSPEFLPRSLFEKFGIELLATTESPMDDLRHHATIQNSDWP